MRQAVLFVCTGNICRSPTAEGVFLALAGRAGLADAVRADSAGTHGAHVGEPPDPRAIRHAALRGYDISGLRARRLLPSDGERFSLILAMDRGHLKALRSRLDGGLAACALMTRFSARYADQDVPDPYYGAAGDFERVLDMVEDAAGGLVRHLRERREGS